MQISSQLPFYGNFFLNVPSPSLFSREDGRLLLPLHARQRSRVESVCLPFPPQTSGLSKGVGAYLSFSPKLLPSELSLSFSFKYVRPFEVYAKRLHQLLPLLLRVWCWPLAPPLPSRTLEVAPYFLHQLLWDSSCWLSICWYSLSYLRFLILWPHLRFFFSSHLFLFANTHGLTFDFYNHQKLKCCQDFYINLQTNTQQTPPSYFPINIWANKSCWKNHICTNWSHLTFMTASLKWGLILARNPSNYPRMLALLFSETMISNCLPFLEFQNFTLFPYS